MEFKLIYILMNVIFYGYVGWVIVKYGILPSVSDSWYSLSIREKILFPLFCWGIAIPAAILAFQFSEHSNFQFLMLFGAAGIAFVGAAPDFKNDKSLDKQVHTIAAITGIITTTLFLLIVFPYYWYFTATFLWGACLLYIFRSKLDEILWIEIASFTSFSITIYFLI